MLNLRVGGAYTRKQVWSLLHPNTDYPNGGPWNTGYLREADHLLIFANIGTPGRTGHDFPNDYDELSQTLTWYGKPNAHSAQPMFRSLFRAELVPEVFVRWDDQRAPFIYLGTPTVERYQDSVALDNGLNTIEVVFKFGASKTESHWLPPEGTPTKHLEGGKVVTVINRYERDPRLRLACIAHHGAGCHVCGFDFQAVYGELGKGFCHVHHIKPLSELGGEMAVDPIRDLLPVCPNCHAMLHSRAPALSPDELKALIQRNSALPGKLLNK